MAHSFNKGNYTIFHNGGFDGPIEIVNQKTKENIKLPFFLVKSFVFEYLKRKQIAALEQMSDNDFEKWLMVEEKNGDFGDEVNDDL